LLKRAFGIRDGDDEAQIIARLEVGTAGWELPAPTVLPYLRFLLSIDPGDAAVATMDPLERRAGILDALRAMVAQAARAKPLVLVIEDLHWIDARSAEALVALVDVVAAAPVLLLATTRPGAPHPLEERGYVSRLALGQLSAEECAALAGGALGTADLPPAL